MALKENHTVSLRNKLRMEQVTRIMSEPSCPPSICPSHSFMACFFQEVFRDDECFVSFLPNKLWKKANG